MSCKSCEMDSFEAAQQGEGCWGRLDTEEKEEEEKEEEGEEEGERCTHSS